jgi:hypothetical protein
MVLQKWFLMYKKQALQLHDIIWFVSLLDLVIIHFTFQTFVTCVEKNSIFVTIHKDFCHCSSHRHQHNGLNHDNRSHQHLLSHVAIM